jgi:hypothetical protein
MEESLRRKHSEGATSPFYPLATKRVAPTVVKQYGTIVQYIEKFTRRSRDTRGQMPIDFLPHLVRDDCDYVYGLKDDGVRTMFLCHLSEAYLIFPEKGTYTIVTIKDKGLHVAGVEALLDGECVRTTDTFCFIANSCLMLDGSSTSDLPFVKRHMRAVHITRLLTSRASIKCRFLLRTKPIFDHPSKVPRSDVLQWSDGNVTPHDGLLIYEAKAIVEASTESGNTAILKCKLAENCTVDFLVEPTGSGTNLSIMDYGKELHVAYSPAGIRQSGIYEMRFDRALCSWQPVRKRDDKERPNSLKVFVDTLALLASVYPYNGLQAVFDFMTGQNKRHAVFPAVVLAQEAVSPAIVPPAVSSAAQPVLPLIPQSLSLATSLPLMEKSASLVALPPLAPPRQSPFSASTLVRQMQIFQV